MCLNRGDHQITADILFQIIEEDCFAKYRSQQGDQLFQKDGRHEKIITENDDKDLME